MEEDKDGLLQTIGICDDELNKENADPRYGQHLIDAVMKLWSMKLLKKIDETNN